MQAHFHGIIQLDALRGSKDFSFRCETHSVSAFEDSQRADGIQCVRDPGESLMRTTQTKLDCGLSATLQNIDPVPPSLEKSLRTSQLLQAKPQVVDSLCKAFQLGLGDGKTAGTNLGIQEMSQGPQAVTHGVLQTA